MAEDFDVEAMLEAPYIKGVSIYMHMHNPTKLILCTDLHTQYVRTCIDINICMHIHIDIHMFLNKDVLILKFLLLVKL